MTTIDKIFAAVETATGKPLDVLRTGSRRVETVNARYAAIILLRVYGKLKLKAIGLLLRRDHSTVIHAIQSHHDRYETDAYRDTFVAVLKTFLETNDSLIIVKERYKILVELDSLSLENFKTKTVKAA